MQSFDPRVNRLNIDEQAKHEAGDRIYWPVFEVFHQEKRGSPHHHVGGLHAPNAEMALVFAKEQFGRRKKCSNIWVVKTEDILSFPEQDEDMFANNADKTYRDASGFRVMDKINKARQEKAGRGK